MNQTSFDHSSVKQSKNYQSSERRDAAKTEYFNGRTVLKPTSNRWHNLIASNFTIAIGSRIHGNKCEVYAGDMRVQMRNNSICFPDVVVVSEEPKFTDEKFDLLQNPMIVIEVFSNATNSSDRTQKLEGYLALASVKDCLLVNED